MIRATIIADSINPSGCRLTTFELTYPRVIHAEVMTHRMFSRNASSSRAIPWSRMKEWVETEPYIPIHWGRNQKGMQATEELTEFEQESARVLWLQARDYALRQADMLVGLGVHKQLVNRLVEPFGHINVVCSATSFVNFFKLRIHRAAMPEIQALATAMARAYRDSRPVLRSPVTLGHGAWHLPYVTDEERDEIADTTLLPKISAARCARVSYKTHDGKTPTLDEDLMLFERLVGVDPPHASPTEHQAEAMHGAGQFLGNFQGWRQYRKRIAGEAAAPDFDWQARLVEWDGVDYLV